MLEWIVSTMRAVKYVSYRFFVETLNIKRKCENAIAFMSYKELKDCL